MARFLWPLYQGQPVVHLYLREPNTGILLPRVLLADTGAGSAQVPIELVIAQRDADRFGERGTTTMIASGAISRKVFHGLGMDRNATIRGVASRRGHNRAVCSTAARFRWHRHLPLPQLFYLRQFRRPNAIRSRKLNPSLRRFRFAQQRIDFAQTLKRARRKGNRAVRPVRFARVEANQSCALSLQRFTEMPHRWNRFARAHFDDR